jgi:SAM-dependent methyltransferase
MAADNVPLPAAVPPPDRSQIERLNTLYRIIQDAPAASGLRARLASGARRLFARVLSRQQEFNAAVVDHINRNLPLQFETHRATLGLIDWVSASVERCEDARDVVEHHLQALLARERRNDAAVAALAAQHEELRAALSVLQQAVHGLKRTIEERQANSQLQIPGSTQADPASRIAAPGEPPSQFAAADSYKYVGFEDRFRGAPDEIRKRLEEYVPIFANASDVLDVGCGRGEFLELLRDRGVQARGIDVNPAMVDVCRGKGLDAQGADALTYLRGVADSSLGGLFAAQVIEHLEPRYLTQLLDVAFDKLRPGAPIVLETINPACWFAFFESYIRDLTHVRPVHPETLKYLLIATGFQHVDIRYRVPYPEAEKLQPVVGSAPGDLVETLNANVEKINRLLFTYLDYAAVGIRR